MKNLLLACLLLVCPLVSQAQPYWWGGGGGSTNWAVPGTIGSTTPNSGAFTSLTASGWGTGIATFLNTPTSANLAAAVTNETGSGALCFATSPTLVTPILGTPQSVTLTNGTGLPIGGLTGLGTGVGTWLATPSSANLASAITDETGSGSLVFGTAPTISSPVITGSAVTFTSGTSRTLANASEIIVCTSTCTVTPPGTLTAGAQFCVQNDDNVSTVITLAAVTAVQYEGTARTSYGTANRTMTSGGAVKDQICMVAVSTTKFNVFSSTGTWTNN